MRIAVCDDEEKCRKQLSGFLTDYAADKGLDFNIQCFESADRLLVEYPKDLDLLFLDIAMPGVDGLSAAAEIRRFDPNVCIIFITTMYQHAIDGYSVRAFGFIKKPLNPSELAHELGCAITQIENTREREQFIPVKIDGYFHRIPISHILYLEVKNHQINMKVDDKIYQYRDSISELESKLSHLGFFRCHSSYLINGEHITKIEQTQLLLRDGTIIPISQRRRKEFMKEISNYLGKSI